LVKNIFANGIPSIHPSASNKTNCEPVNGLINNRFFYYFDKNFFLPSASSKNACGGCLGDRSAARAQDSMEALSLNNTREASVSG